METVYSGVVSHFEEASRPPSPFVLLLGSWCLKGEGKNQKMWGSINCYMPNDLVLPTDIIYQPIKAKCTDQDERFNQDKSTYIYIYILRVVCVRFPPHRALCDEKCHLRVSSFFFLFFLPLLCKTMNFSSSICPLDTDDLIMPTLLTVNDLDIRFV